MRYLDEKEAESIKKYYDRAIELLKKSDCKEANYGAVIFKDDEVMGEGYNYVPKIYGYTCDKCPRRNNDLHKGIGLELCYSVHAEESAINDMIFNKGHKRSDSKGSNMIVVRAKNGEHYIFKTFKPYCTRCAEKIYTQTDINEIIYEEGDKFIALKRDELFNISIINLHENWKEKFDIK